jgi:polysaccharide biosynthesis/export protein
MSKFFQISRMLPVAGLLLFAAAGGGCTHSHHAIVPANAPRELNKVSLPDYVIEPPDVLQIDLIAAVPKPPYRIQPLDVLALRGTDVLPESPIAGLYPVEADGTLNLGGVYGSIRVDKLTIIEAKTAIEQQLLKVVRKPIIDVSLAQGRAVQQVRGPHLVRLDGTIGLGTYGGVRVVGLTVAQAKATIEAYLAQFFEAPEISLDVTGFNSKVYYVLFDGAGVGQQVIRLPITGNETVLDAVGLVSGLTAVSDSRKIWVARPSPDCQQVTVLPVDWKAVTEIGDARTNYQLMSGDRVFVKALPAITFSNKMERVLQPIERLFGFTLLGVGTVRAFENQGGGGGAEFFGGF